MDSREFLKRYAWIYCYVAAFVLICAGALRHSVEVAGNLEPFLTHPVIVIDAGHGGMDGGTMGLSGVREDQLNLAVSRRLNALLALFGYETAMIRTTEEDLSTAGETIRQRKQSDLRNRVEAVNALPSALLVSIHQNHFPDSHYSGPQVFWSSNAQDLARSLQTALNTALAPASKRSAKEAAGVYLMERVQHPAVLVECGFLSNTVEEQKLCDPEYQKRLASVLAATLAAYLRAPA